MDWKICEGCDFQDKGECLHKLRPIKEILWCDYYTESVELRKKQENHNFYRVGVNYGMGSNL